MERTEAEAVRHARDWAALPHVSIQEYVTAEGWRVTFLQVSRAGCDVERWLVEVLPVSD